MPATPPFAFDASQAPYVRWLEQRVKSLEDRAAQNASDTATSLAMVNSSITQLNQRVKVLSAQAVQYYSANNSTYASAQNGVAAWITASRPSVQMSTPTGRIKIGFGVAVNNGNGIAGYSIVDANTGAVYVDKSTFVGDQSRSIYLSGGASFTPTGFKQAIVTVPANTLLTITVEMYCSDGYAFFFSPNLLVEVAS
jgi:hypothetical protein